MKITPEFKAMVKQALKEIKQDQQHEAVHVEIRKRIVERLERGRSGGAFCGICNKSILMHEPDLGETV